MFQLISFFSKPIITLTTITSCVLYSSVSYAVPFMNKAQYADYSVRYQCAEQRFHNDLEKKELALIELEEDFGINDDTYDAFDELIPVFEKDDDLLDSIRSRVQKECF